MKLDLRDFSLDRISRVLIEQTAAIKGRSVDEVRKNTVDFYLIEALLTPAYAQFVSSVRLAMQVAPQDTIVALVLLGYQMAKEDVEVEELNKMYVAAADTENNSNAAQP